MIALVLTAGTKAALVLLAGPVLALFAIAGFITRDARRHRRNLRELAAKDRQAHRRGIESANVKLQQEGRPWE
jgi:cytochrome c-type biogenesis protein CcmH/NrfF